MPNLNMEGKVALVSGASDGIELTIPHKFYEAGVSEVLSKN